MKFQRTSAPLNPIVLNAYQAAPVESRWAKLWKRIAGIASPEVIWDFLAKFASGSTEPVVEKRCDRQGYTYYAVYDPVTQQRTLCSSEAEVRAWLEQRYYQSVR